MSNRRWAVAGVVVAASMSLAVAGCGNNGTGSATGGSSASASASASAGASTGGDAKQHLATALQSLSDQPFHMTVTGGSVTGSGDADPTQKNMTMTLTVVQANGSPAVKMNMTTMGDQLWIKLDMSSVNSQAAQDISGKWLHVDTTKLGPNSRAGMASGTGPVDTSKLVQSANNVKQVDATHYTGTIDLTQGQSMAIPDNTVSGLADKAKAIPFQATVDDHQRLTELKITIPAVGEQPAQTIDTTYSNFGTPVSVTAPPASSTVEAPQVVYDLFKS